jgi:GH25 family lysozyme M1 (1,4-beta-N-acetylmuramidase)
MTLNGFDISSSNHNGQPFNWPDAKAAGYDIVYVEATGGNNYLNTYLIEDCRNAYYADLAVGVYHFYDDQNGTPEEQAQWFTHNGRRQVEDYTTLHPVLCFTESGDGSMRDRFLTAMGQSKCGVLTSQDFQTAIGYGADALFGWLIWDGWTIQPLPVNTAIVQNSNNGTIPGIGNPVNLDVILDDNAIGH